MNREDKLFIREDEDLRTYLMRVREAQHAKASFRYSPEQWDAIRATLPAVTNEHAFRKDLEIKADRLPNYFPRPLTKHESTVTWQRVAGGRSRIGGCHCRHKTWSGPTRMPL
jgi:hypothetical protein